MFCSNCGNELLEGDLFCTKCGMKVTDSSKTDETVVKNNAGNLFEKDCEAQDKKEFKKEKKSKKKKLLIIVVILFVIILLCSTCGGSSENESDNMENAIQETQQNVEKKDTYSFDGTTGYTIELPNIYKEKVVVESLGNGDRFYLKSMYNDFGGGTLFSISKEEASYIDEYGDMYVLLGTVQNGTYYYVVGFPSDWESVDEAYKDDYMSMLEYYDQIVASFNASGFVSLTQSSNENDKSSMSDEEYRALFKTYSYDELERYPDKYYGVQIKATGDVYYVADSGEEAYYMMYLTDDIITEEEINLWPDTMSIRFSIDKTQGRIVEGDKVTFYGTYVGLDQNGNYPCILAESAEFVE